MGVKDGIKKLNLKEMINMWMFNVEIVMGKKYVIKK
jgi:hypothetical protein